MLIIWRAWIASRTLGLLMPRDLASTRSGGSAWPGFHWPATIASRIALSACSPKEVRSMYVFGEPGPPGALQSQGSEQDGACLTIPTYPSTRSGVFVHLSRTGVAGLPHSGLPLGLTSLVAVVGSWVTILLGAVGAGVAVPRRGPGVMALSPHLLSGPGPGRCHRVHQLACGEDVTQLSEGKPEGAQRPEGRQGNRSRPQVAGGEAGLGRVAQGMVITPSPTVSIR